jgi:hypothetical protein
MSETVSYYVNKPLHRRGAEAQRKREEKPKDNDDQLADCDHLP